MKRGDKVVYLKPKHSSIPSPRGINVSPSDHGEDYDYTIKKYWTIFETDGDTIACITRRNKIIEVKIGDPHLRKANLWERILLSSRFPKL